MAQIKISQLTPKNAPLMDTDLLAIAELQVGTYESKKITGLEIAQRAQQGMQAELVSGTNIKTIEGQTLLGSGNIDLTKADVGLSNVDNTSDMSKPISTDMQTALDDKQEFLVSGTNIKTVEGQSLLGSGNIDITKADVGLSNVDNTSDLNKPISTATQTALNAKQDTLVSGTNIKTINGNSVLGSGNLTVNSVNPTNRYVPFNYNGVPGDSILSMNDPNVGYFGWSGFKTQIGQFLAPPIGVDQSNIAPYLDSYGISASKSPSVSTVTLGDYYQNGGLNFGLVENVMTGSYLYANNADGNHLYMDFGQQIYYFGYQYGIYPYPLYGLQIEGNNGTFSINAGANAYSPAIEYNSASNIMLMRSGYNDQFGYNGNNFEINNSLGAVIINTSQHIKMANANMFATGVATFTMTSKALKIVDNLNQIYYLPLYTI